MNMIAASDFLPLISVIIPTFNAAVFLPKAINSVLQQTYSNVEIIILDDGSTDNTRLLMQDLKAVKYFYQENMGLSSARNAGIRKAQGEYLVFLDADDWLEKDALVQNFSVIKGLPHIAFVSGNYYLLRAKTNQLEAVMAKVIDDPYIQLLRSNYIGMHAAVLFQRWIFQTIRYDESLKACEDYDIYLTITRKYPVMHHQKIIATYYFHPSGLSHNYQLMMDSITAVIKKQRPFLKTAEEKAAYHEGLQQWKQYCQLINEVS